MSPEVLEWIKSEQHRRWKDAGREPTYDEILRELIATFERRSSTTHHAAKTSPAIPSDLTGVVDWVVELFAGKGSAEQEVLKSSIRVLAARRQAVIDRKK